MSVPDLCTQLLPFAPRPFPDELLLSWMCRLAAANHVKLDLLVPELERINSYHLNCHPAEDMIGRLAVMARLPGSTLISLLLPKQFPNLSLLTLSKAPQPSVVSGNDGPFTSFPVSFAAIALVKGNTIYAASIGSLRLDCLLRSFVPHTARGPDALAPNATLFN
jgi:hypothetical protein